MLLLLPVVSRTFCWRCNCWHGGVVSQQLADARVGFPFQLCLDKRTSSVQHTVHMAAIIHCWCTSRACLSSDGCPKPAITCPCPADCLQFIYQLLPIVLSLLHVLHAG